jgi:hypothetical protein
MGSFSLSFFFFSSQHPIRSCFSTMFVRFIAYSVSLSLLIFHDAAKYAVEHPNFVEIRSAALWSCHEYRRTDRKKFNRMFEVMRMQPSSIRPSVT